MGVKVPENAENQPKFSNYLEEIRAARGQTKRQGVIKKTDEKNKPLSAGKFTGQSVGDLNLEPGHTFTPSPTQPEKKQEETQLSSPNLSEASQGQSQESLSTHHDVRP